MTGLGSLFIVMRAIKDDATSQSPVGFRGYSSESDEESAFMKNHVTYFLIRCITDRHEPLSAISSCQYFVSPFPAHHDSHIEDQGQAEIGNPGIACQ